MRFENEGKSADVQDRRGAGVGKLGAGAGVVGVLIAGVIALLSGKSPISVLGGLRGGAGGSGDAGPRNAEEARAEATVRRATTDIQDFWTQALPTMPGGRAYERTQLVIFNDRTRSACGRAEAATGPFYCPGDRLVYVDLGFYGELDRRFEAPGDFAQAYVLAHEFGHHLQTLLGIEARVRGVQQADRTQENPLSVLTELQADCFAGVWGASASRRGLLEAGDVEEGLRAAASIGDDRIQRMGGHRVNAESWTHGSSEQRVTWFRRGMQGATIAACDTFGRGTLAP